MIELNNKTERRKVKESSGTGGVSDSGSGHGTGLAILFFIFALFPIICIGGIFI